MAKYKRRADGRYYTLVNTGKYDDNGKPIRIPLYASSSKKLEEKVGELKTDLRRGTYANDNGITLAEYAKVWFKATKENKVSPATARDYLATINNHFDQIGEFRLMDLKKSDIELQLNQPGISKETRRRITLTIKQILEAAIDDGLLYRNVARGIRAPKPARSSREPLSDAEKTALKKCSFSPMESAFVHILFGCGLRRGEALALMPSDIDFRRRCIRVSKSLSHVRGKEIKETKSEASRRSVDTPDWLLMELKAYLSENTSLYLFHDTAGQMMNDATFRRFWKRIVDKINAAMGGNESLRLTHLTPHTFRHNYATMLYYSDVDVKEAQRLLGHANISVTLEIYTHLREDHNTADKINSIAL